MSGPLQNKRILVTRPAAQAAILAEKIAAKGGDPVFFPLLEIGPTDDQFALQYALSQIDDYAMAVFISPNAVDLGLPFMLVRGYWPAGLQAVAIGQSTAAQLMAQGVKHVIVPSQRFDSEALLELPEFMEPVVSGKRVLILRGNGGRELLAEGLSKRGAQVDLVTCYKRSAPTDGSLIQSLLHNNRLDALTISSSEGLRNLLTILDAEGCQRLRILPVFVPHRRIAEVSSELGLQNVVLTGPADAGIVEGLCTHNWQYHE